MRFDEVQTEFRAVEGYEGVSMVIEGLVGKMFKGKCLWGTICEMRFELISSVLSGQVVVKAWSGQSDFS